MASGAKEKAAESGSEAGTGPLKAAVGPRCPICLGAVRSPAYVAYCMHQFCFRCIRHWARGREDCPVCRQALEQVLHSVRGDDDYELFMVGLPARLRRRMAWDRAGHYQQRRYDLRRRPGADRPQTRGAECSTGQGEDPEPSRTQAAPTDGVSQEPSCRTSPGASPDPRRGGE